jgi:hypothetical protein
LIRLRALTSRIDWGDHALEKDARGFTEHVDSDIRVIVD